MWSKNIVHETLKRGPDIHQTEGNHKKFIMLIMSSESGFVNVFLLDADLVVPGMQV
jgi:hypothetical protein